MEIRRFILLVSLVFTCCTAIAGSGHINDEDIVAIKKEMNRIKTNEAYIAAEATGEMIQDAFDMALMNLSFSINSQRILQGLAPVEIKTIRPYVHSLSISRGSMQRVLVYIVWADIEKAASARVKTATTSNEDELPVDTIEVVVSIPLVPSEENVSSESTSQPEAIKEVLASLYITEMIVDGVQQLDAYKAENKISDFGRCDLSQPLQSNLFLLLFDRARTIRGILEVRADGTVCDIKTDEIIDSLIKHYGDCKAYWFK